jgi:tRNA(Ile)-lysidine synthase
LENLKLRTEQLDPQFSIDALSRILFDEFAFGGKTKFIVAYSGGCDSQVLLHGLAQLRSKSEIEVTAAHFDHGLQGQSATWKAQCREWCAKNKIRFVTASARITPGQGDSIEAVARDARYRWLGSISGSQQVVVTAHHADDQAETFLLHLFQGKDIDQLAGIAPSRPLLHGSKTRLIRPLLGFHREQLERYARANNLVWIEDPANNNHGFYRNYIRHEFMPILRRRWPGAVVSLNQGAAACRRIAKRDQERVKSILAVSLDPEARGVFCLTDPLDLDSLIDCTDYEITGVLRYWIHNAGHASPSNRQMETLYHQVIETRAVQATLEFNGLAVRLFNHHLYLTSAVLPCELNSIVWNLSPVKIPELGIIVKMASIECKNGADLPFRNMALELAWRKGGEKVRLCNRKHHSSLKKVLQERLVPTWERNSLPFLMINKEIAWIHGVGGVGEFAMIFNKSGIGLQFSGIND